MSAAGERHSPPDPVIASSGISVNSSTTPHARAMT